MSPRGLSFGHGWNRAGHRIASFTPRRLDQTEREKRWTHRAGTARRVPRPYVQSPTLGLMLCISPPLVNRGSCVRLAIRRFLCRLDRCQSSGRVNPQDAFAREQLRSYACTPLEAVRTIALSGISFAESVSRLTLRPWVIPATIERSIKSGTIRVIIRLLMTLTRYNEFETRSHKRAGTFHRATAALETLIKFAVFRFVVLGRFFASESFGKRLANHRTDDPIVVSCTKKETRQRRGPLSESISISRCKNASRGIWTTHPPD